MGNFFINFFRIFVGMRTQTWSLRSSFHKQKASAVIKKLLESAIANAENNEKADIDLLFVKSVIVNQGMRLKRMKPRARGRADRIIKPTCHIEIILSDQEK